MTVALKKLTLKEVITGLVILVAALVFANIHTPKVLAASYDPNYHGADANYCGVHTNSEADYEGLIATVSVVQQDGSVVPANGTQDYVHVTSSFASGAPRAAILELNTSLGVEAGPYQDVSFGLYGGGTACYGGGVLGYGGTSVSTIDGNAGGWWVLDCDTSTGTQSYFTINGQGVPANGIAGGTWTGGAEVGPSNGATKYVALVYHDPAGGITGGGGASTNGNVDEADCSQVAGWDESDPNASVLGDPYPPTYVDIYINGPAGSGSIGKRYLASNQRSDVGPHGFAISTSTDNLFSPFYNSGSAFTAYIYFIGQNGAPNVFAGAYGIGPCVFPPPPPNISLNASCSAGSVNVTASDSTSPVTLTVNYSSNNGGPSGSQSTGSNSLSFNIPMSGYDSTKAYAFSATVTARNGAGSASNSTNAIYGPCDTFTPSLKIQLSCSASNAKFSVSDSDDTSGTSTIYYSIDPPGNNPSYSNKATVESNGSSTASVSLAGYDQLLTHQIYAYTLGVQKSGAVGNRQVFITPSNPTTYGPCYTPSCGTLTSSPAAVEPSQNYSYSVTLGFSPTPPAGTKIGGTLQVYLNNLLITPHGTFSPPSTGANQGTGTAPAAPSANPNGYAFSWTFTDGSISLSCPTTGGTPPTLIVAYKPYIQVLGGDTSVGGGFAPNCTPAAKPAGAIAWNQDNAPTYTGAGDQFAVYAIGPIDGFATAQGGASAGTAAKGLAFANNGATYPITTDQFGGGLTNAPCAPDYYSAAPAINTPAGTLTVPSATTTTPISVNGNLTLNGSDIPNAQYVTIYVKGNVEIQSNIIFSSTPAWTQLSDIPSFRLVVEGGNITIDPGVTELDGTYIAEPDSSGAGGTITTCEFLTAAPTTLVPPHNNADCFAGPGGTGNNLVVKGSFIAQSVMFARSNNDANGTIPAEQFIYSPANWLNSSGTGSAVPNKYDSITSLPPVL